jgi:transposase
LEALKGNKTLAELGIEFAVHPNQVSIWKHQLLNNMSRVFDLESNTSEGMAKIDDERHAKIGRLMAENDFLTKVLGRNI